MKRSSLLLALFASILFLLACGEDASGRVDGGGSPDGGGGDGGGGNGLVSVTIEQPQEGDNFAPGESIRFVGSAVDTRDGTAIPNDALRWTSDVSGQLGIGATIQTALPEGAHTITLTATAADGTLGSASVHITVAQPPLEVTIARPRDRDIFQSGTSITFECRVRSNGTPVQNAEIVWSTEAGQFGLGATVVTALPDGRHQVTCTATDPATGDSGSDTIGITVGEPAIRIDHPMPGQRFDLGSTIEFRSTVLTSDPPPHQVVWSSSIDGQIGIGQNVTTALASAGTHVITASFTDAMGTTVTDSIEIEYVPANRPPVVTITEPANDGATFTEGQAVTFTGSAVDPEDGDLSASGRWSSPTQGSMGTGATAAIPAAAPGKYVVSYEATDSAGATGRDRRLVYVEPAGGAPLSEQVTSGSKSRDVAPGPAGVWVATDGGWIYVGPVSATVGPGDVGLPGGARPQTVASGAGVVAFGSKDGLSVCQGSPGNLGNCTAYRGRIDDLLGTTEVLDVVVLADGTVVAATKKGLFVVEPGGNTRGYDGGDWNGADLVRNLALDGGIVWMATEEGLRSYDPATGEFTQYPDANLANRDLRAVAARGGEVWVGHDQGISHLVATGATYTWQNYGTAQGLSEPRVLSLDLDSKGVVWGGTDGGGALRFDPAIERFLMITTADGLASNVVNGTYVDPLDIKYFATDAGTTVWRGQ